MPMVQPSSRLDSPAVPRRVLILRPGALGDIIRTLPAIRCLRVQFPESRLEWAVYDSWKDLLIGHPDLDEILVVSRHQRGPGREKKTVPPPLTLGKLIREIRIRRYDLTLDFQGTLRSGLLARLSGCTRRYGFSRRYSREGNFLFNNHRVRLSSPQLHRVDKNLTLVRAVGARSPAGDIHLSIGKAAEETARRWLGDLDGTGRRVILLVPGTSLRQTYKRWPPVHYARLAHLLHLRGEFPVIAWGPGEADLASQICEESAGAAHVLPASSIPEMAAVMLRSSCVVAGDTGPAHLTSALGIPLVAIFGGTDPRLNAPRGRHIRILDGSIRPAGRRYRKRHGARFLASLLPETVAAAVADLLTKAEPNAEPRPNPD